MDKDFFSNFDQRKNEFAGRAGLDPGEIRAEILLGTGQAFVLDAVVDARDGWIQIDVRDAEDDEQIRSIVTPYYQIQHVRFVKQRPRVGRAGFGL
jgi:hypothetical protein